MLVTICFFIIRIFQNDIRIVIQDDSETGCFKMLLLVDTGAICLFDESRLAFQLFAMLTNAI